MEALEELEVLLPALEEFAADSGVASTIGAAKDRVQKAQANIPQAKLKFAAEPLRAALDKTASQLDVRHAVPSSLAVCECPTQVVLVCVMATELHQDVAARGVLQRRY
jgi:hypothetical protein